MMADANPESQGARTQAGTTSAPPRTCGRPGAALYTAAEGIPPFAGATMPALIAAILTKVPARPSHAGPLLEEVLRHV